MLRVLGAKAALGLSIPRVQANLVELDFLPDGGFDYAACLFSTLGLIEGANRERFLPRRSAAQTPAASSSSTFTTAGSISGPAQAGGCFGVTASAATSPCRRPMARAA